MLSIAGWADVWVKLRTNLVYHVRFEPVSAPSDGVACIHVDVHAVAHGIVVLASADDENHGGLVHMLLTKVAVFVPILLRLRK